jgi:hypothetical protein
MTEERKTFFIPDLADTPDRINASGQQTLTLRSITQQESNKNPGSYYLLAYYQVSSQPEAVDVSHMLMLPDETKDEQTNLRRRQELKEFFTVHGFDVSEEIEFDDMVGTEVEAILKVKVDAEYGDKSSISRFVY